jgi:hypothetical protein
MQMSDHPDWIFVSQAVQKLSPHFWENESKKILLDHLISNRLLAQSGRIFVSIEEHSPREFSRLLDDWESEEPYRPLIYVGKFSKAISSNNNVLNNAPLPQNFWRYPMGIDSHSWTPAQRRKSKWQCRANWRKSEFETFVINPPNEQSQNYVLVHYFAAAVSVDSAFVECLIPKNNSEKKISTPKSGFVQARYKYDWLGAFAHVASVLCFDDEITNPEQHGSQAKIERMMAHWFAKQGQEEPSPASLKTHAKIIMGALRSKASSN